MKKFFLSFSFFVFAFNLSQAQESLIFNYDEVGNQLERNYECIGCGSNNPGPDLSTPENLRAYPNPTSGIVTIDWVGEYKDKVSYILVTSVNNSFSKFFYVPQNTQSYTLDLTGQHAGVYIVGYYLNQPGVYFTRKIIKL